MNILDVVTRELTSLAAQKKNLSLAFWEGIIKDFDLVGGWAEDIPKPAQAESVRRLSGYSPPSPSRRGGRGPGQGEGIVASGN